MELCTVRVDNRLAGAPRYVLTSRPIPPMRIPDSIKRSVVFIGVKTPHGDQLIGTGFIVGIGSKETPGASYQYLVTARHVVVGLAGVDMFVQVLDKSGAVKKFDGRDLPWFFHPDPDVDVACIGVSGFANFDVDYNQNDVGMLLDDAKQDALGIGIGDEVFIAGLFTRLKETIDPIMRVGNIAMQPKGKVIRADLGGRWADIEGLLIDQRSLGGMSGCPVFVRETLTISGLVFGDGQERPFAGLGRLHLLGLMHGHWKVDPAQATAPFPDRGDHPIGMSIVIPASKIYELLHIPALVSAREDGERRVREQRDAQIGSTATNLSYSRDDHKEAFNSLLDAAVKGKP